MTYVYSFTEKNQPHEVMIYLSVKNWDQDFG